MNWYYVESGEQRGPVTDADLEALAKSGAIQPTTLVWHEGMADWQPYQQAKPAGSGLRMQAAAAPEAAAAPAAVAPAPAGGLGNLEAGGAVCSECNRLFALDEVIKHGDRYVCAACKPSFLQKLKEGVGLSGGFTYAGFWIRVGAKMLDTIILYAISFAFLAVLAAAGPKGEAVQLIVSLLMIVVGLGYSVFFVGKYGATPGKMACKLKIIRANGDKLGYLGAFGRLFAEALSGMICYIGYIMVGFDQEKRGLHDRICSTRVIKM